MDENEMIDEEEYEFSRNYFLAKESGKSVKKSSARKVSELNLVDEQVLRTELSNIEPKHEKEIALLINSYKKLYNEWVFELRYGFGLLMYGFGSKKTLIEDFASTALTEYSVIVVNGYLQSVNLKQFALLWHQNTYRTRHQVSSSNQYQSFHSEMLEPSNHIREAVSSSNQYQSFHRTTLDLNAHFVVPGSVDHEDRDVESIQDEHIGRIIPLSFPLKVNANGNFGQIVFDVCVPKNVEDWDLKSSSSSYSKFVSGGRNSHISPVKCIERSKL